MFKNSHSNISTLNLRKKLHLLPVSYRIKYKLALLAFKCSDEKAPKYLKDLVNKKPLNPNYNLRPENQLHLPLNLRIEKQLDSFKKGLKTHYFNLAYSSSH